MTGYRNDFFKISEGMLDELVFDLTTPGLIVCVATDLPKILPIKWLIHTFRSLRNLTLEQF